MLYTGSKRPNLSTRLRQTELADARHANQKIEPEFAEFPTRHNVSAKEGLLELVSSDFLRWAFALTLSVMESSAWALWRKLCAVEPGLNLTELASIYGQARSMAIDPFQVSHLITAADTCSVECAVVDPVVWRIQASLTCDFLHHQLSPLYV
jgi:hypothetical protein